MRPAVSAAGYPLHGSIPAGSIPEKWPGRTSCTNTFLAELFLTVTRGRRCGCPRNKTSVHRAARCSHAIKQHTAPQITPRRPGGHGESGHAVALSGRAGARPAGRAGDEGTGVRRWKPQRHTAIAAPAGWSVGRNGFLYFKMFRGVAGLVFPIKKATHTIKKARHPHSRAEMPSVSARLLEEQLPSQLGRRGNTAEEEARPSGETTHQRRPSAAVTALRARQEWLHRTRRPAMAAPRALAGRRARDLSEGRWPRGGSGERGPGRGGLATVCRRHGPWLGLRAEPGSLP